MIALYFLSFLAASDREVKRQLQKQANRKSADEQERHSLPYLDLDLTRPTTPAQSRAPRMTLYLIASETRERNTVRSDRTTDCIPSLLSSLRSFSTILPYKHLKNKGYSLDTWQILTSTSSDKNDGMLLEIVALSGDVAVDGGACRELDSADFSDLGT